MHVTLPTYPWQTTDWFNKRLSAWINLRWLGRGRRFRDAEAVLSVLVKEVRERNVDHIVFSGDASALGFESEIQVAANLFGLNEAEPLPGIAVPGNHDYTAPDSAKGGFERCFAPWQQGTRFGDLHYPFAQKVGHVWLIGMCSATPNRWPWDASGMIDEPQLVRLTKLVQQLDEGPRIMVTHYPICTAKGNLEPRTHRLRNVIEVAEAANEAGIGLWLHGHRHAAYQLDSTPFTAFPVICCGSSTQSNVWTYAELTIRDRQLSGLWRTFNADLNQYVDGESFELTIL